MKKDSEGLCSLLIDIFFRLLPSTTEENHGIRTEQIQSINQGHDRAMAQAVSRRLPNTAARVRARVRSCEICGAQSGTAARFLRVFRFTLPIRIPQIVPQSSSSIFCSW
jgi:ribosomal protein S14